MLLCYAVVHTFNLRVFIFAQNVMSKQVRVAAASTADVLARMDFTVETVRRLTHVPAPRPLGRTVVAASPLFVPQTRPFDTRSFKVIASLPDRTLSLNHVGLKVSRMDGQEGHSLLPLLLEEKNKWHESTCLRYFVEEGVVHMMGHVMGRKQEGVYRDAERNRLRHGRVLFTLPPEIRPPQTHDFLVLCDNGRSDEQQGTALLRIHNNGVVTMQAATVDSALQIFCRVEFDGIRFKLPEKDSKESHQIALHPNIRDTRPSNIENDNTPFRPAHVFTQGPCVYLSGQVHTRVVVNKSHVPSLNNMLFTSHCRCLRR